jgi:ABC-2 type transport system ATP-binding protein
MPELRIRNLSKTYPDGVQALQDVNLSIPPGMYGLLGPNGAGKATLMRTIATLQEPDTGEIHLGAIDALPGRTSFARRSPHETAGNPAL